MPLFLSGAAAQRNYTLEPKSLDAWNRGLSTLVRGHLVFLVPMLLAQGDRTSLADLPFIGQAYRRDDMVASKHTNWKLYMNQQWTDRIKEGDSDP